MKRNFKLLTIMIVFAVLFGACEIPIQVVTQTQMPPQQLSEPHQVEVTNTPDDSVAYLQATISVLETQMANLPKVTNPPVSNPTAANTQVPVAMSLPNNTAIPTVAAAVAAATYAPTPTPPSSQPPVVNITPIATLQSPYPYYSQYYPYYPQPYPQPYPYNYYPNTYAPCNRATFIADVNVLDNTNFAAGTAFTKTWRIRNDGTCTWTTSYSLVFDHGNSLSGPSAVNLPVTVTPGMTVDLSVNLVAPSSNGVYQGFWMLQDASGGRFGIGYNASVAFWVKITVGAGPSNPYYPYYHYYPNYYSDPDHHPYIAGNCELIAVSPPMYTKFSPNGDTDIKWTIKNISGSTWSRDAVDYRYISGTKMYKNGDAYDLQTDVASGSQVDIVVDTVLPSSSGAYTTTWGLVQGSTRLCTMSVTLYVK